MRRPQFGFGVTAALALATAAFAQPTATDLGTLPTGETRVSGVNVVGGTIVWYQFQTPGATQGQNTYLDIITEAFSGDSEIGLYDLLGNLIASDDDDGAGLLSALSFGATGQRPPVGTGVPGDGRDGDLFSGSYYLALGNYNTTFNPTLWDATSANTTANNFFDIVFTFGEPPPPPPPPTGIDLGVLPTGETRQSFVNVDGSTVVWYTFETTGATQGQNTYLDIITDALSGDSELGLYTSTGDLVAADDDDGDGLRSALSFGSTQPRPPVGTGVAGNGRDGDLFAGTYFLALSNFSTTHGATNWNVLSTSSAFNTFDVVFTFGEPPPPPPPPANDECFAAEEIPTNGPFPYLTTPIDISGATSDFGSSCTTSNASVWYKITAAQDGFARISTCSDEAFDNTVGDTVLEVYESSDGSCNSLTSVACNDDTCGLRAAIDVQMVAGRTYYIYAAAFGSTPPPIGSNLQIAVTGPTPPPADQWIEVADAGDVPNFEQVPEGSGTLGSIRGVIDGGFDVDMYQIQICDVFNFSASTVGGATIDTQLWLFNADGTGVAFNDDAPGQLVLQSALSSAFVGDDGTYLLAVSTYNNDANDEFGQLIWANTPFDQERAPDGPGAFGQVASWTGLGGGSGPYTITLTGACFPGGTGCAPCAADYDQSGGVDGDDIGAFFADWTAGADCADVDESGGVDGDDIGFFFARWTAGGCD